MAASHRRAVWSALALRMRRPSDEKLASTTQPVWPFSVARAWWANSARRSTSSGLRRAVDGQGFAGQQQRELRVDGQLRVRAGGQRARAGAAPLHVGEQRQRDGDDQGCAHRRERQPLALRGGLAADEERDPQSQLNRRLSSSSSASTNVRKPAARAAAHNSARAAVSVAQVLAYSALNTGLPLAVNTV